MESTQILNSKYFLNYKTLNLLIFSYFVKFFLKTTFEHKNIYGSNLTYYQQSECSNEFLNDIHLTI